MSLESDANLLGDQILDVMHGITEEQKRWRRVELGDRIANQIVRVLRLAVSSYPKVEGPWCHHREWTFVVETNEGVRVKVTVSPEGAG